MTRGRQAAKGLTTVALLKVYFDQGHDHIDMFLPFVLDVIRIRATDDFQLNDIKTDLLSRHGLSVPVNTLQTLLVRAARRKKIRREGGRYFRKPEALEGVDLLSAKVSVEREHAAVAKQFREFASRQGLVLQSDESALGLIVGFLEKNQVGMLLEPDVPGTLLTAETLSRREMSMVARFLQSIFRSDPQNTQYVQRMLEGLVLQSTLLLSDISLANRRFVDLTVFFDTGFLLEALGFAGESRATLARETLDLLKSTNARLAVFQKTVEEIKRVLSVYERNLGTLARIKTLRPTEVTRYLLTHKYTPSDVAQAVALLEKSIGRLGLAIREFPDRDPKYTLDESALSRRLKRPEETELEPRVMHDVDCAAAILTYRAGHGATSLDDARAVFATTSGLVVKDVRDWYRESGEPGVGPVVHVLGLSNIAWLKNPGLGQRIRQHELIALCAAALQPSRKVWESFLRKLRTLEESGELSFDEYVAVVASALTDTRLSEVEEDVDVDSETVAEVVEQVKAAYAKGAAVALDAANETIERLQVGKTSAEVAASKQGEDKRQFELRLYSRVETVARWAATGLIWLVGGIALAGVAWTLPNMFPNSSTVWKSVAWVCVGIFAVLTVYNLFWGGHLGQVQLRVQTRLSQWLKNWLMN